jgi:hypothetical protein
MNRLVKGNHEILYHVSGMIYYLGGVISSNCPLVSNWFFQAATSRRDDWWEQPHFESTNVPKGNVIKLSPKLEH